MTPSRSSSRKRLASAQAEEATKRPRKAPANKPRPARASGRKKEPEDAGRPAEDDVCAEEPDEEEMAMGEEDAEEQEQQAAAARKRVAQPSRVRHTADGDREPEFHGDPFPAHAARAKWPHRYQRSGAPRRPDEEEDVKARCHYSSAKVDGTVYSLNDDVYVKDLEPEVNKSSAQSATISAGGSRTSKRVMAVAIQEQDQPPRITRQRTRELVSAPEHTTVDPQDDSTADGLMAANANTETNNQNELSTEDQRVIQSHISMHIGRDLDNISRGLTNNIPVHIAEGKLRPEVPLQAAKLASEAGIILRNHVPIFTHWKHYKDKAATAIVKNFNDKVSYIKVQLSN